MRTWRKAEANRADQKKVAGKEFEIAFDRSWNIGMVVVAKGRFPEKRGPQKSG